MTAVSTLEVSRRMLLDHKLRSAGRRFRLLPWLGRFLEVSILQIALKTHMLIGESEGMA